MKRLFAYLWLLLPLCLVSCNRNNPNWKEEYKEGKYYLVKFNPQAVEYRPNVMLVPDSKGVYRIRSLQNGGTCKEFFMMHDPFLEIDSACTWYLVDWKWGLYLSYAHCVLPMRWVDVREPDASYVRSDFESAASGIIDTIAVALRSDIDLRSGIIPAPEATTAGPWGRNSGGLSTDHLAPVYLSRYFSTQDVPEVIDRKDNWEYTKQDFLKERLRQDSLQSVYRARLEQLIYNGRFRSAITIIK